MKKHLLLIILVLSSYSGYCQVPPKGSVIKTELTLPVVNKRVDSLKSLIDSIRLKKTTTVDTAKKSCGCTPYVHKSRNWGRHGWLLVFSPLILFVLLMGGVLIRTRKFSLSDALTENVTAKKTIKNEDSSPEGLKSLIEATEQIKSTVKTTPVPPSTAPVTETTSVPSLGVLISSYAEMFPPTIVVSCDNDKFRPSSSRLLALISCLLVMAFVVGIACFYIYQYMYTGCPPDLSGMTGVLVTLGIGVVPYTGNKIGAAFKGKE